MWSEGERRGWGRGGRTVGEVETELAQSHHVSTTMHGGEEVKESEFSCQLVSTESRGQ